MFKVGLVKETKYRYLWLVLITVMMFILMTIMDLPESTVIVKLFYGWQLFSIFLMMKYPYQLLNLVKEKKLTLNLPLSNQRLFLNELKPWMLATLIYLLLIEAGYRLVNVHQNLEGDRGMSGSISSLLIAGIFGVFIVQSMSLMILESTQPEDYGFIKGVSGLLNLLFIFLIGIIHSWWILLIYLMFVIGFIVFSFKQLNLINQ